jgi:hypothetical protein
LASREECFNVLVNCNDTVVLRIENGEEGLKKAGLIYLALEKAIFGNASDIT